MDTQEVIERLEIIKDKADDPAVRGAVATLMGSILSERVDTLARYLVPFAKEQIKTLKAIDN